MRLGKNFVFAAAIALALLPVRAAFAAPSNDKELEGVLRRLDAAAASFRSTSADFEFDSVQTDPVPDKDVQQGAVYYERKGKEFQMAAHIREFNGKPAPKVYAYSDGVLKLYEKGIDQVTTFAKAGKYESYLMLGFGASGKDLEQKWEIRYLGSEVLMDGKTHVKTEKLELVAKDPAVRKNIPKVTVWIDPERAVSLKQVFSEGSSGYRVSVYFNIKTNQPLPSSAFVLDTDRQTQYVSR
jgi:outer membrane lipoprotein-sorting protein